MKPFPGPLKKEKSSRHPYILTAEQEAWFCETFPTEKNEKIMSVMGISPRTLRKFALKFRLKKNPEWIKLIKKQNGEEHKRKNRHVRLMMISGHNTTKCTNIRAQAYTPHQTDLRHRALKRGYLLDEDISEGSRGRYVIYYDDETRRSAKFEANCLRNGLRIERD